MSAPETAGTFPSVWIFFVTDVGSALTALEVFFLFLLIACPVSQRKTLAAR